jgi:hypothetical protein
MTQLARPARMHQRACAVLQLHAYACKVTQPCTGSSRCVQHVLLMTQTGGDGDAAGGAAGCEPRPGQGCTRSDGAAGGPESAVCRARPPHGGAAGTAAFVRTLFQGPHCSVGRMHDLTTHSPGQQRAIAPARLQDELNTAASGDFQALRQRLKRAEAANADLEQVMQQPASPP